MGLLWTARKSLFGLGIDRKEEEFAGDQDPDYETSSKALEIQGFFLPDKPKATSTYNTPKIVKTGLNPASYRLSSFLISSLLSILSL